MNAAHVIPAGLLAATLLSGGAQALTPAWILCNNADGSIADFIEVYDASDEQLPGMTMFSMRPTDPDADKRTDVIVHCATRQAVSYVLGSQEHDGYELIGSLIDGDQTLTLRQLARRLKREGVQAKFGKLAEAHCACRPETHESSF